MKPSQLGEWFSSDDPELRRQAVVHAARQGISESDEILLLGLGDADWRVRKEAVHAIREHATEPWLINRLVEALRPGDNVGLRNAAVEALGAHGEAAIFAIGRVVSELDADGRKLAAEAVGLTQGAAAMPLLQRLSSDADMNVRAAALEAIAQVGRASPEAAAKLLDAALAERDPFLRLVTLDVIRRLGLAPTWERLRQLLADPLLVQTVLELSARLGEPQAAPHFIMELEGAEGQRQRRAVAHLAQFICVSNEASEAAVDALRAVSERTRAGVLELCRQEVDPAVRADAMIVCAALGKPEVADVALSALADDRVADAARCALSLLGSKAKGVLIERLRTAGDVAERAYAIEALARIALQAEERDSVLAELRELEVTVPTSVRAWLVAMTELADQRGLERGLEWLSSEASIKVRRAAIAAARRYASAFPVAARELAKSIQPNETRAGWVCWFAVALDEPVFESGEADVEFLSHAASNPAPSVRVAALSALAKKRHAKACDAILFALSDEAEEVQRAAIAALSELRDEHGAHLGTKYLLDFVSNNGDPSLQSEAIRWLEKVRAPEALPQLSAWVSEPTAWKAAAAVEALGGYDERVRWDALINALKHEEPVVVKAALQVLSSDNDIPEAQVVACLNHPVWDVRRLAADVLGTHDTPSAREALSRRLGSEGEPMVTEAIVRSLARLEPPSALQSIAPPSRGRDRE